MHFPARLGLHARFRGPERFKGGRNRSFGGRIRPAPSESGVCSLRPRRTLGPTSLPTREPCVGRSERAREPCRAPPLTPADGQRIDLALKDDENDHTGDGQSPTQRPPPTWGCLLLGVVSDLEHGSSPPGGTTRCRRGRRMRRRRCSCDARGPVPPPGPRSRGDGTLPRRRGRPRRRQAHNR